MTLSEFLHWIDNCRSGYGARDKQVTVRVVMGDGSVGAFPVTMVTGQDFDGEVCIYANGYRPLPNPGPAPAKRIGWSRHSPRGVAP